MVLHPQIAALVAQLDELVSLLKTHGERLWSGRIDLCRHLIADSNFAGVERFLRLFEEEDGGLSLLTLKDPIANARLIELRKASRVMADRLAREEHQAD